MVLMLTLRIRKAILPLVEHLIAFVHPAAEEY
jgi:hypothetical protein